MPLAPKPLVVPAPEGEIVRPSFWQCAPCKHCGQKSWAVPWEPQAVCLSCFDPVQVVEVYLPTNPGGSRFAS
jgi:hypothetical protein